MNDCIFCKILKGDIPSNKVYDDDKVTVILDAFPKSHNHMLIIPNEHLTDIMNIDSTLTTHIHDVTKKMIKHILTTTDAKGVEVVTNIGINQEIKHYHLHLIPIYEVNNSKGYGYQIEV